MLEPMGTIMIPIGCYVQRAFEVREICLLELVSPRMQASQQTLQTVLIQSGSAIISRRAKVRDSLLGHKRLIGVSPPKTEKQTTGIYGALPTDMGGHNHDGVGNCIS